MRKAVLSGYHRLPPALRSAMATLRGGYLRASRYGPETEQLVEEALSRETWSPEKWRDWQEERLAFVLHRAATCVPYYRDQWRARRRHGDRASWECLEHWPLLEKEAVRQNPRSFVADDCSPSRMFHDHTSGTTGKSLDLWLTRETVRAWYALYEARGRRWYGVSRHDRWAIIGGQLVAPVLQNAPPFWVWNAALSQLYMSAYHLAPHFIGAYTEALRRYRITYVLGYPSALHAIAREVCARRLSAPRLTVALTNAEPIRDDQRQIIAEAFDCPVRESYGMAEVVAAAGECEHGRMHLWPEVGWLEVINSGSLVPGGGPGEFVCTGLLNADMPLIRYRVGDRGALSLSMGQCLCGRMLPQLAYVEGRLDDVLYTADGRAVGRLDPVFKSRAQIREAQIIQEALTQVRVRYVPAEGFSASHGQSMIDRLRARLGPITVVLEEVDSLPRTTNGKFRAVICNLSPEERESAESW